MPTYCCFAGAHTLPACILTIGLNIYIEYIKTLVYGDYWTMIGFHTVGVAS